MFLNRPEPVFTDPLQQAGSHTVHIEIMGFKPFITDGVTLDNLVGVLKEKLQKTFTFFRCMLGNHRPSQLAENMFKPGSGGNIIAADAAQQLFRQSATFIRISGLTEKLTEIVRWQNVLRRRFQGPF